MSTDTGHNSSTFSPGDWALNNPEAIIDWGWRALHGSVELSKDIIEAYYAQPPKYSYFSSCSTGGRQALKSAQAFPEDFDGVIAGAPAWWTSRLQPWTLHVGKTNLPVEAPHHIPDHLFPTILAEIVRQCDGQDGVTDNLLTDPDRCAFYPETLLCNSGLLPANTDYGTACLSPQQLTTLRKIYSTYVESNQTFVFPSLSFGADAAPLVATDARRAPHPLGTSWVQSFVLNDSTWNFYDFSHEIIALGDRLNPGSANADDYSAMAAFGARGGRVIMYHGLADPLIPAGASKWFYDEVLRSFAASSSASAPASLSSESDAFDGPEPKNRSAYDTLNSFLRLFLVPGMSHCGHSAPPFADAPWFFGQAAPVNSIRGSLKGVPGFEDAEHNVLLALMRWVEEGVPPEWLVATKFEGDSVESLEEEQKREEEGRRGGEGEGEGVEGSKEDKGGKVVRQSLLCPYPRKALFKGGDPRRVAAWECGVSP